MQTISRRRFLGRSALGLAAGYLAPGAIELDADPLGLPLGFQVYPVRQLMAKDFDGTLKQLAAVGYRDLEMCSPQSYGADFAYLAKMKPSEIRQAFDGLGLRCVSCHYQFRELKENLDERIAAAKELGLRQMVLSTFANVQNATLDDWRRNADELNKVGEKTQQADLQLGFHNHNYEFREIDGVLVYDELMRRFDPKLVKMQFQVSVISLGFEAAKFLDKYPGRFISLHLQDYSAIEKKTVAVGTGVVDWKKTFAAAKTGGIRNYFVEMNLDAMLASAPRLRDLKV